MAGLRLLALAIFIAAVLFRSVLLGGIGMVLGSATVVTGLWNAGVKRGLRVRRVVEPTLGWNTDGEVELSITNSSLLPVPWVQIEESVPPPLRATAPPHLVFALPPGESRTFRYPIHGSQRGWYAVGPLRLTTGDVLGFRAERLAVRPNFVTVLPRVVPLTELGLPATLPWGPLSTSRRRGEDPARPAGVRPYQASDGVRRIDWKATAHRNELMVRRADPTIAPETTFALTFRLQDYPARVVQNALERAITAVASLAVALLGRKLPVGLIANGYDPKHQTEGVTLPLGKGDGQRQLLLEVLGRLEAGRAHDLLDLVSRQPLPWGGTLALVMADLTPSDLPRIAQLRRRGQQVVVVLVEATAQGTALAKRLGLMYLSIDSRGQVYSART